LFMRWGLVCLFWIHRDLFDVSVILQVFKSRDGCPIQRQSWTMHVCWYTLVMYLFLFFKLRIHISYLNFGNWIAYLFVPIFLFLLYQGGNWSYSDFWSWLIPVAYYRDIWGVVCGTLLVCWTFPSFCWLLEQFHIGRFWRKFTLDMVKRLVKN